MKTFKDLFLDESADIDDTPRRTIKASLRMAMADNGSHTGLAQAGRNEDDLNESDQKGSEAAADKRVRNLLDIDKHGLNNRKIGFPSPPLDECPK
jgi:hypothetical protein